MGAEDRVREDGEKARTLITSVLLGELSRRVLEYENATTWNTTCLSCSRVLDSAYADTVRREKAEAKLAALRSVLLEGGQDAATVRRRALAITGSEEEASAADIGQSSAADRAMVARATSGGIRSREVQPVFDEEAGHD